MTRLDDVDKLLVWCDQQDMVHGTVVKMVIQSMIRSQALRDVLAHHEQLSGNSGELESKPDKLADMIARLENIEAFVVTEVDAMRCRIVELEKLVLWLHRTLANVGVNSPQGGATAKL